MEMLRVVCGVIWKDEKVFIARRKAGKSLAGYWEFPGGKIEVGEQEETALLRELKEELGMEVSIQNYLDRKVHEYEKFSIELIAYECKFLSSSFSLTDHDRFEFINPGDFEGYQMAPADIFVVEQLCK